MRATRYRHSEALRDPPNHPKHAAHEVPKACVSLFGGSTGVLVQSSQQDCTMNANTPDTELDIMALLADIAAYEAAEAAECAELN